jgi:hypothetical protein
MMLQHWHAQQRTSISAAQRRFCGIVGLQNGGMRAVVIWMPGPPPLLRLTFQHARLADDARALLTISMECPRSLAPSTPTTAYALTTSLSSSYKP